MPASCGDDPYRRLCLAVVIAALRDLGAADPILAIESLAWLLGEGQLWAEAGGVVVDDVSLLRAIQGGRLDSIKQKYFTKNAGTNHA